MPTVQELAAQLTRETAEAFARSVEATPPDRQTWVPLEGVRTVLSQVQECAVINGMMGRVLRDREAPKFAEGTYEAACGALSDPAQALEAFKANTTELAETIAAFPAEHLDDAVTMPWATETFASLLFGAYWNTVYHLGQVNYIQTMYGDKQMH